MTKGVFWVLSIFYSLLLSVYWLELGGGANVLVRNAVYLLPPLIATLAGIFALSNFGWNGHRAKTLLALTLGLLSWCIGEALFFANEFIFHIEPYPSAADIFYLLGYPLFLYGLIHEINVTKINWKSIHPQTTFLLGMVSTVLVGIVVYFGVYLAYDAAETLLHNAISIAYGLGDLVLVVANLEVLILAWEFRGGKLSRMWQAFFFGFLATLVADILFAMFTMEYTQEHWFYKSLLDSFWMVAYLLFAYGLLEYGISILETSRKLIAAKAGEVSKHSKRG